MNHAGIRSALSRIAWAYLLIHLHFRLNNLDLLPDWAGYLLIFSAIGLLAGELRDLPLLRPFCILLGAVSGVDWLSFLLTGAEFTGRFFLLSALITCVALYFHFQLLTDLAALADRAVRGGRPLLPGPPPAAVPQRGRGVPGGLLPAPLSGELAVGGAADCSAVPALAGHLCRHLLRALRPAPPLSRGGGRIGRSGGAAPASLCRSPLPPRFPRKQGPCRQTGGTAPLCSYSCSIWLLTRWMIMSRATAFLPPSGTMRSA